MREDREPMQLPKHENRVAPKGRFRLLEVDTFEGPFAETVMGSFPTVKEALDVGTQLKDGHGMLKYYVYDDKGDYIAEADPDADG